MNDTQDASGTVWAVFGHRFAIEGEEGRFLADLGPQGAEGIALEVGDAVSLTGERKPSEIKVRSITLKDGSVRTIAWPKKPRDDKAGHDPAAAIAAVKAEGYAVEGEPERKPKHFEIVGSKDGARHEIHVARDGKIRKTKPLAAEGDHSRSGSSSSRVHSVS